MSVQRQSSPPEEADLEITAELPVLDITAFEEASAPTADAAPLTPTLTPNGADTLVARASLPDRERLGQTDTWIIPAPTMRVAAPGPEAARPAIDENRARLELNLQALSTSMREVEERLRNKDERLTEIERALEAANAERVAVEQRARGLAEELARARGSIAAAEARLTRLQQELQVRDASAESGHARDSDFQSQLATRAREFEAKLLAGDHALARAQRDLTEAKARAAGYLETLQTREVRRSVFEGLLSTLDHDLAQRDMRLAHVDAELSAHAARAREAESTLHARTASIEAELQTAKARGDEQEKLASTSQSRATELDALLATQRRRAEQLELEVAGVRGELQVATSALQEASTQRNEHTARLVSGDARVAELEERVEEQQDTVRLLQAECNASTARAKELEGDLSAAEDAINRLEADARNKGARIDELERLNHEWRATVEEARRALTERDQLIQRLEEETANSATLIGHIQKSITRLDHGTEHAPEPVPDGAARLLIRTDGDTEVVHVLGRKTSIGRTPDNDVQVDSRFISRHHAVILAGPAHAIIEDLNSTNGVLVNNRRITRQPLKDGDHVTVGKTQFRFVVRPTGERR